MPKTRSETPPTLETVLSRDSAEYFVFLRNGHTIDGSAKAVEALAKFAEEHERNGTHKNFNENLISAFSYISLKQDWACIHFWVYHRNFIIFEWIFHRIIGPTGNSDEDSIKKVFMALVNVKTREDHIHVPSGMTIVDFLVKPFKAKSSNRLRDQEFLDILKLFYDRLKINHPPLEIQRKKRRLTEEKIISASAPTSSNGAPYTPSSQAAPSPLLSPSSSASLSSSSSPGGVVNVLGSSSSCVLNQPLASLNNEEVCKLFKQWHRPHLVSLLREHNVNGRDLLSLSNEGLQELGVHLMWLRQSILTQIQEAKEQGVYIY